MQLQDAEKQKAFDKKLEEANRGMEEHAAQTRSAVFNLPFIDLSKFPVDLDAVALFSEKEAQDTEAVPFFKDGSDLRVGTMNPDNPGLEQKLQALGVKKYKPKLYFISHSSYNQVMKMYARVVAPKGADSEIVEVKTQADYVSGLKNLEDQTKVISATDILATILGAANQYGASDIHLEPQDAFVRMRLRLDGVLTDLLHLPKQYQKPITSRIKILSKMKLNVDKQAQDGRFTFAVDGKPTDVRVSALPSAYGEAIVMRLLGQAVALKFDDLGFVGKAREAINNELHKPNGMIVTTGPTGSGKTTTLYAFLNELNKPGVNIITLEDPIEYKLAGINQTPVNAAAGLDFANGLRSILRQDPDVVMVGEIRDSETADVALQASLTGHVVLSTLHTNDAAGAIPRLITMGVKPFVIAPGLNAIIAQRLVRKLCQECKKEVKLDPFLLEKVNKILSEIPKAAEVAVPANLTFYHSDGCAKCNYLGYKGRIGIFEVIVKSDELDKLIMAGASTAEIKEFAVKNGMVNMMQDGILKALSGTTDVEEVFRVTQE